MVKPTKDLFIKETIKMENETQLVNPAGWEQFEQRQKMQYATDRIPQPNSIKFNGSTGLFSVSHYDEEKKERVSNDLGGQFEGVILAVRYFIRWKYQDNAPFDIRSREFSLFKDEQIELLKYDNANRGAEPSVKHFMDYDHFKSVYGQKDIETDKVKMPHDLWVSLYILVDGKIERFRFCGTSRGSWFDYKNSGVLLSLVVTLFKGSEPIQSNILDENGQPKCYHSVQFINQGDIPVEMRQGVVTASTDLDIWMRAWEEKRKGSPILEPQQPVVIGGLTGAPAQIAQPVPQAQPVQPVPSAVEPPVAQPIPQQAEQVEGEEILLSEIPF